MTKVFTAWALDSDYKFGSGSHKYCSSRRFTLVFGFIKGNKIKKSFAKYNLIKCYFGFKIASVLKKLEKRKKKSQCKFSSANKEAICCQ